MRKCLRIFISPEQPERCTAIEFLAERYVPRNVTPEQIVWRAPDALATSEIIDILRDRGWHQTDIFDELDEARLDRPNKEGIKGADQTGRR